MAFKVPTKKRQVSVAAPQLSTPSAPQLSSPKVIPGAFGIDRTKAIENLGKIGEKVASHLTQLAIDKQDKEALDVENSYRLEMQNRMLNQDDETVTINGKEVTRKKGLLSRQLGNAKGSTEELDRAYQDEIRERYTKNLSAYQKGKIEPRLDKYYISLRENVITHEANQLDDDFKLTTDNNIKQKILDASIIRDDKQLSFAIDDAVVSAEPYNRRFDEVTRGVLNQEIAQEIATSAIISTIEQTGDYDYAKLMLDGVKDNLSSSAYSALNNEISKRAVDIAISRDMSLTQEESGVMQELQKGKRGSFHYLPTSERIKAIKESQRKIFYNSQIATRENDKAQDASHDELLVKEFRGELELSEIENALLIPENQGGIPRNILLNIKRRKLNGVAKDLNYMLREQTPDKDPTARAKSVKTYLELIDSFTDDAVDKWTAREKLSEAWRDGILNSGEQIFLNDLKSNLKDIQFNRWSGGMNSIIKGLKTVMRDMNASDEDITIEIKRLLGTLAQGKQTPPDLVTQRVKDYIYNNLPEIQTFSERGQNVMDELGSLSVAFPDGRLEPFVKQPQKTESNKGESPSKKKPEKKTPKKEKK